MMEAKRIAEIQERCDKATKGPWVMNPSTWEISIPIVRAVELCTGSSDAEGPEGIAEDKATASFIAHARQDLPDVLAQLQAAQEREAIWLQERATLRFLLADLVDITVLCDYDRNGYCREHDWGGDVLCPHARAREILKQDVAALSQAPEETAE